MSDFIGGERNGEWHAILSVAVNSIRIELFQNSAIACGQDMAGSRGLGPTSSSETALARPGDGNPPLSAVRPRYRPAWSAPMSC
jgi:hypothetical protein